MRTTLFISATLLTLLLVALNAAAEVPPGKVKATFVVHCYTVGVNTLAGKPGVLSVEPGWSGSREVNRVIYSPEVVTVKQLEDWLIEADTYVETLETTMSKESVKEMAQ